MPPTHINNYQSEGYHTRNHSYASSIPPFEMNKPQPSRDQSLESFKNSDNIRGISPLMRPLQNTLHISPRSKAENFFS